MKKYALAVAAMSLVFMFTQQDDAHAFNRLGGKQASGRVLFKLGDVQSGYMSSLSSAMGNWSWGTNNNIKFSQTTNDAIYSAFFQGNYYGDTGWNGLCNNMPNDGAIYTKSVVSMNYTYGDKYDESKRMAIWTHEMGHALGLAHVRTHGKLCVRMRTDERLLFRGLMILLEFAVFTDSKTKGE